jgi:hypothetical protein
MQTYEYKHQREIFDSKARAWTRQHAAQMKNGEPVPAAAEEVSLPTVNKEQLDVLEDEHPSIPVSYSTERVSNSVSELPAKIAVDINKENGAAGGAGKLNKHHAEIEKPSLDTSVLRAEKDTQGINKAIDGAEPPQKKSKLSLQRN